MIRASILVLLFGLPSLSFAIVDMKSANYSESWTDLEVPGIGYDLRVNRTYNSRSLFNGMFGFGWCSDYETRIDVTTEGNMRLTECGGGMEVNFTPKNFSTDRIDATVKTIIEEVKRRRPDLKGDYVKNLERELKTNDFMREEFGRRMNIKGRVEDGVLYLANGREAESISLKAGVLKRTLPDGTYQLFEAATGRMTAMYDKNQNHLKLAWDKETLQSVSDNLGRKLSFKFNPMTKKVAEIIGPNNLVARYGVKGEDLAEATDAKGQTYKYTYDDVHNLTKIEFSDKSFKTLAYNKDKDWVVSFRNRKGCVESYDYQVSKDDPQNHYWSNVVKKCDDKVTNQSKYEFFHKPRADRTGVFLYRVRTEINSAVTDIVYHEFFGKPLSIFRDGAKTDYVYLDNGMVKSKREPGRMMEYEYKNSCNKVSQVVIKQYEELPESPGDESSRKPSQKMGQEKLVKTVKTKFIYESQKCNLITADSSDGIAVKLQYDALGRISQIEDQAKRLLKIKYEPKFGKPWIVTRPGLGTIQVSYKADGEIAKVESKEGQNIAVQVASIFNNLLEVIAPATGEVQL